MIKWFSKLLGYELYFILYPLLCPNKYLNISQMEAYYFYIYTEVIWI